MRCGTLGERGLQRCQLETVAQWRDGGALLGEAELLLQGLGHLGGRGAGQAEVDLDRVVDEPLQGGQSTNHDDTGNQTLPHT